MVGWIVEPLEDVLGREANTTKRYLVVLDSAVRNGSERFQPCSHCSDTEKYSAKEEFAKV